MISRASSGDGSGFVSSAAVIVVRNPGVQNPHCRPWQSANACCTGDNVPSGLVSPSTVVIRAPSALTASIRHDRTATPSSRTVHAPQTPCSQPTWVPVSRRSWRRQSDSSRRAGTSVVRVTPLTIRLTSNSPSWGWFIAPLLPPLATRPLPRVRERAGQRPLGQNPGQMPAVGRRRVNVGHRRDAGLREPPAHLCERAARARTKHRQPNLGGELIRPHIGLKRAKKEIFSTNQSLSATARQRYRPPQEGKNGCHLTSR